MKQIAKAQKLGAYKRTSIDDAKDDAIITVLQVGPYVVYSKVKLSGRGIVPMKTPGRYMVTSELVMAKLHRNYKVMSDF